MKRAALALLLTGCAWFSSNEPTIIADGEKIAACVIARIGEPDAQIAGECGVLVVEDVGQIISNYKIEQIKKAGGLK